MKNAITLDQLNAETALTLPDREMLLITIVVTNVLNGLSVDIPIDIKNNMVAVQVCAVVDALGPDLIGGQSLDCRIEKN